MFKCLLPKIKLKPPKMPKAWECCPNCSNNYFYNSRDLVVQYT